MSLSCFIRGGSQMRCNVPMAALLGCAELRGRGEVAAQLLFADRQFRLVCNNDPNAGGRASSSRGGGHPGVRASSRASQIAPATRLLR
eukprot:3383293-Pyramimonas_sp.AAC.1